jgi:DnaK suppressor protein
MSKRHMNNTPQRLDESFIASQRQKLVDSRNKLLSAMNRDENEDRLIDLAARNQASESEDQAQDLTISDNNRILVDRLAQQLVSIDRARAKIDDGTYGFSDVSGQPIPLVRLQAFPEAIRTMTEEARHWDNLARRGQVIPRMAE